MTDAVAGVDIAVLDKDIDERDCRGGQRMTGQWRTGKCGTGKWLTENEGRTSLFGKVQRTGSHSTTQTDHVSQRRCSTVMKLNKSQLSGTTAREDGKCRCTKRNHSANCRNLTPDDNNEQPATHCCIEEQRLEGEHCRRTLWSHWWWRCSITQVRWQCFLILRSW